MSDNHCEIEDELARRGLRKTVERHKILEAFAQNRTWTAANLHAALPRIDLSTIYRNLRALNKKGLIRIAHIHAREEHYEATAGPHHDHLVCASCHVIECTPCPTPQLPEHQLEVTGLCASCK